MNDIFISYASEDRERARTLALALEARGWSVWWDREIPLGRSYDDVIEQALAGARCMLVLWSAAATASEWVRSEASEGKRRNILVPVFIEDVDAPLAFRLLNGARLENWEPGLANPEFERLTQHVSELLAKPPRAGSSQLPTTPGATPSKPQQTVWGRVQWTSPRVAGTAAALLVLVASYLWFAAKQSPPPPTPSAAVSPAAPASETAAPEAAATAPPGDAFSDLAAALKPLTGLSGAGNLALRAFRIPALGLSLAYIEPDQSRATGGALPAGAVVWEVADGAAQQAGVQALDVVNAIDGQTIRNDRDLRRLVGGMGRGKHTLRILRNGARLNLTLDCRACEPKPASQTKPAPAQPIPSAQPKPRAEPAQPKLPSQPSQPTHAPAAPAVTPSAAAKPARPTLIYAALGLPINRRFWSGETRAGYTQKIHATLQRAGRDVLRMNLRELELDPAGFDAWWDDSAQRRSRELCAASPAPVALLSARVETPPAISRIESAYWPELKLRLYVCANQRLYRQQKSLSPMNQDAWPFETELNSEIERFLRSYRADLIE